jgi:hypothetical protein
MSGAYRWSRILVTVGLIAMLIGALDPLEGSLVILPGTTLVALGAMIAKSGHRRLVYWALTLVATGVGVLWGMSSIGGFGGDTGRPMWWAAILLPYPVGFILAVVGAFRQLREPPGPAAGSAP